MEEEEDNQAITLWHLPTYHTLPTETYVLGYAYIHAPREECAGCRLRP